MPKASFRYVCQQCAYSSPKWLGRCPECGHWNSFVEEAEPQRSASKQHTIRVPNPPTWIGDIEAGEDQRVSTGISELDRVLGGGVVRGSAILIGGDPGIGKSTILLQAANNLSSAENTVLYVSGEESLKQIKLRANRLGVTAERFYLISETNLEEIRSCIDYLKPDVVIIDSIQTMYDPSIEAAPATVAQVRSCTSAVVNVAKSSGTPVFIVGHVTKEGAIAGPRVLEHMVDTVLYFEGDRHQSYRILRAVKNRFGSTDELGIFEMRETGLVEVPNPSEILLSERSLQSPGSIVTATMEGTRPLLVEVQALVARSYFAAPRRMVSGVDYNRAMLILAVLEKRTGLSLANQDVYINIVGGVRIVEPAVDLAVAVAVASSLKDMPLDGSMLMIGEIGLGGEVRSVSQLEKRITEAERLGFERAMVPARGIGQLRKRRHIHLIGVESVFQAADIALGGIRRAKRSPSRHAERPGATESRLEVSSAGGD